MAKKVVEGSSREFPSFSVVLDKSSRNTNKLSA